MVFKHSLLAASFFTAAALWSPLKLANAQDSAPGIAMDTALEVGATPRQIFTSFITGSPIADLRFKPYAEGVQGPPVKPAPLVPDSKMTVDQMVSLAQDSPKAPPPPEVLQEKPADAPFKTARISEPANLANLAKKVPAPTKPPEKEVKQTTQYTEQTKEKAPEPQTGAKKTSSPPDLLPFYTDAPNYLASRGAATQTHMALTYDVVVANAKSGLKVDPKTVTLILGPDFAAAVKGAETRIFDFKMSRVLTVRSSDDGPVFDNVSLYPAVLNTINTVNSATQRGARDVVNVGAGKSLDAFWLESSLGWAARTRFDDLEVVRSGNDVTSWYQSHNPVSINLAGPDIPSDDHMRSLFAYWLHDIPIHPAILPKIGRPDKAPTTMSLLSYTPSFPDGLIAQWTLIRSDIYEAEFPLPPAAAPGFLAGNVSPLALAISQAATGKAMTNAPDLNSLREELHQKRGAGEDFEAWITAQVLAHRLGGCDADPALLCKDIKDLEESADLSSPLGQLSVALKKTKTKSTRAEAFEALVPFIEDGIAPAFLVKRAGQLRARIADSQLSSDAFRAIRAETLLEEALIKNPYDPETYQTLAQVYAARSRYAESWDVQDAMRLLPDVTPDLSQRINAAETSLRTIAPGFFMAKVP